MLLYFRLVTALIYFLLFLRIFPKRSVFLFQLLESWFQVSTKKYLLLPLACLVALPAFSYNIYAEQQISAAALEKLKSAYRRPIEIPFPPENEFTLTKANLGKTLFFDPRLSASGTQSCATCHNPSFAWGDGMGLGTGDKHKKLGRKSPSILNLAWDHEAGSYMWDGRKESLEEQALGPIQADVEMNMDIGDLLKTLKKNEGYKTLFDKAFPDEKAQITAANIAKSLATYERTIVSGLAPFDRWIMGDDDAISEKAVKGFMLFNEKAGCASCHSSWRFSDASFHDIGLKSTDIGRGAHVPIKSMQHAFKTVGLRNIDQRAPYMHDGSLKTLADVIEHYDNGFVRRASLSDEIKPLNLTVEDKQHLETFLISLTSVDAKVYLPTMPH